MESVIRYYSRFDEWGRLDREPIEFIVNWHYILKHLPETGAVLDNGAGPGKYAMSLAQLGYQVTLTDLTPRLVEVAQEKAAENGLLHQFEGFHALNATALEGLEDQTYDAALMLGPFYHLQLESERNAAALELHRVTKPGSTVFVAFQTRTKMLLTSLMNPQQWKPLERMDRILEFQQSGEFNHADSGRFTGAYYFQTNEIESFMEQNGFETLELIGSTNLGALLSVEQHQYWQSLGEDEYQKLVELLIEQAADPALLGISSHLLYIGKRK